MDFPYFEKVITLKPQFVITVKLVDTWHVIITTIKGQRSKFEGIHNGGFQLTTQKKSSEVTCFSATKLHGAVKKSEVF